MYNAANADLRSGGDGFNRTVNETVLSKMLSFSPIQSISNLDYEDSIRSFRYQDPSVKYDGIDCTLGHYDNSTLSEYQNDHHLNHSHHIHEPSQYYQKQQQRHQRFRIPDRQNIFNNHSDRHFGLDLYNKNSPSPPKCVQRYPANGKINNYHNTGNWSKGDIELESSHSNDFYEGYDTTLSEDHYQYYYSYHFKQKSLNSKQDRLSKLPITRKMAFQKNGLVAESGVYKNHILKEKSINNNKELPCDKNDWDYDTFKTIGNLSAYSKDKESCKFENSKYYDDAYKIKQSTLISHFSPSSGSLDIEKDENGCNNNSEVEAYNFSSGDDEKSQKKISEFPCHTQNNKRCVRVVNESSSIITDDKRMGYILAKIRSRQQYSKLDSRQNLS